MIKSQGVAKFVDRDAVKIKDWRRKGAAIGVPRDRLVKDCVGFFEIAAAITKHGHRQCAAAKIAAENFVIEYDRHFIVPFHCSDRRVLHPGKLKMREVRVPSLERVNGGIVKGGEAVTQGACPGAEGKLHGNGAVFHPGKRNAVIKFADVAERSGCNKGERDRWKKVANFHWGEFARRAEKYRGEQLLTSR